MQIDGLPVAYAYDPIEQEHSSAGHPENRGRLAGTMSLLRENGILDRLRAIPVTPVSRARLELVHPAEYVDMVARIVAGGGGHLDPDTYAGERSLDAAMAAVGGIVGVVEAIMSGEVRRGMSLMRPPGHHALRDRAMGFCIFANVAVAAEVARRELGLERVLIVDWDVHHGNGTEAIFADDPDVAFFSTHQYPFYPGTGATTDVGIGPGEGATCNVPLPPGIGDDGYRRIFTEVLAPFARKIRPEIILVSAGYDAHWRDPLANESVSVRGFGDLTRTVVSLADELCEGRLALTLEGGYDLEVLPYSVLASLRVLEDPGAEVEDPFGAPAHDERLADELIQSLAELHSL